MAQRVELQSARPISELRCPPATELMWQPPPKDRHPVAPALKGRSAALQYCLHRSAPRESCQTRNLGKTPKPERFISVAECCCRYRTRRTDHVAWGTGPAGRPHRPTQAGLCDARSLSKGCLLSPDTGVDSPQQVSRKTGAMPDATSPRLCHFGRWQLLLHRTCAGKAIHILRAT